MEKIPNVKNKDIERIIERDFGKNSKEKILNQLQEYGIEGRRSGQLRVWSAILKLADKDIDKIAGLVEKAKNDYRDVLAPAEYPIFWKMGFLKEGELSSKERNNFRKVNWTQYQEWFNSKS
jgi:hypothetical protein